MLRPRLAAQPLEDINVRGSIDGKLHIFPHLRFQCSGEVTHLTLSLDDSKTNICKSTPQNSVRLGVSILQKLDQPNRYRFLSTYTFAVATGEVLRQCRGQNVKRVDLELGYVGNGSLVVGPGLVIGLQYPITMEIMSFQETSEGNRTSVISASSQIPLNLFHVVISGSVFQASPNPRKISVISVRKSKLSAVPLIDVSIRGMYVCTVHMHIHIIRMLAELYRHIRGYTDLPVFLEVICLAMWCKYLVDTFVNFGVYSDFFVDGHDFHCIRA